MLNSNRSIQTFADWEEKRGEETKQNLGMTKSRLLWGKGLKRGFSERPRTKGKDASGKNIASKGGGNGEKERAIIVEGVLPFSATS